MISMNAAYNAAHDGGPLPVDQHPKDKSRYPEVGGDAPRLQTDVLEPYALTSAEWRSQMLPLRWSYEAALGQAYQLVPRQLARPKRLKWLSIFTVLWL